MAENGTTITVSFRRLISPAPYENMEASVTVSQTMRPEDAALLVLKNLQANACFAVLEHLRQEVRRMKDANGLTTWSANLALRQLGTPEQELYEEAEDKEVNPGLGEDEILYEEDDEDDEDVPF